MLLGWMYVSVLTSLTFFSIADCFLLKLFGETESVFYVFICEDEDGDTPAEVIGSSEVGSAEEAPSALVVLIID